MKRVCTCLDLAAGAGWNGIGELDLASGVIVVGGAGDGHLKRIGILTLESGSKASVSAVIVQISSSSSVFPPLFATWAAYGCRTTHIWGNIFQSPPISRGQMHDVTFQQLLLFISRHGF